MKDENENLGTNTESYEDYIPDGDNYIEDNSYQGQNVSSMNQNNVFTPGTNGVGPIGDNGLHKGINGFKSNNINNNNNFKKDNAKNNKDNPAMGNNKKDNANSKRNPALGQNNNQKQDGNKMPGAKKNDNNKNAKDGDPRKRQEPNKKDDKTKSKSKNKINKNLLPSGINPFNRGSKNSSSASKTAKDAMKKGRVKGAKMLWTVTPIPVKVAVVASISIMLIAFLLLAAFGVSTATGVAVAASLCNENEYNADSSDVTEFLKGMLSPFGEEKYTVGSLHGWRNCPFHGPEFHEGIDITSSGSKDIHAVYDGVVESAGNEGGYGNSIKIKHSNGYITRYSHLSSIKSGIKSGTNVKAGQVIGVEGSTGSSTGSHLDFGIYDENGKSLSANPFFGYSDQGYEKCIDQSIRQSADKCDLSSTGKARKLGDDGFTQIGQKTNSYSDSKCCNSYSSSVSSEPVDGLPKILTQEFVNGAIQTQSKYGVPASLTLAQIIQESSGSYPGNLSGLAYNCKNLFGIKGTGTAGTCKYSTGEYGSGGYENIVAGFRKYSTYSESIDDHGKLLAGDIYTPCTKSAKTSDDWAKAIKKCGYATDPNYAENLIKQMKQYNLYQYDDASMFGSGTNNCESSGTGSGDIVERANQEYEKWSSASSSERSNMVKSYLGVCWNKPNNQSCNDWCAGFVSFILKETGKLDKLSGYSCMAASYSNVKPKENQSITVEHHKQGSGYTPQPGDVVVYGVKHVGLVEKVEGKTIHTIEGNTSGNGTASCWSGSINKHTYPINKSEITEFVTIK